MKYTLTSVAVPKELAVNLKKVSDSCEEPVASIYRQVMRVAIARGWSDTALDLKPLSAGGERQIIRVAASDVMLKEARKLSKGSNLGAWFRASAERTLELYQLGDRSVWNLLP